LLGGRSGLPPTGAKITDDEGVVSGVRSSGREPGQMVWSNGDPLTVFLLLLMEKILLEQSVLMTTIAGRLVWLGWLMFCNYFDIVSWGGGLPHHRYLREAFGFLYIVRQRKKHS